MKIRPIGTIKNTFVRRALTILVIPIMAAFLFIIFLPVAGVIDTLISYTKHSFRSVRAIVWDFPYIQYYAALEAYVVVKKAFKEGWYGSPGD